MLSVYCRHPERFQSGRRIKSFGALLIFCAILCCANPVFGQLGQPGMGGFGGGPSAAAPQQEKQRYRPKQFAPTGPQTPVLEVRLKGNKTVSESRIRGKMKTRAGRPFDPSAVSADVRHLLSSGLCYDVRTYKEETPQGVIVTFELFEQPVVQYVKFTGDRISSFKRRSLLKKAEVTEGQPLSRFRTEEARRKLLEYYKSRGHAFAEIEIQEGTKRGDKGMVFAINEGPRQRIRWTSFEGNTIVSDARLRTQVSSKPGYLWILKGEVDRDVIEEDLVKLTSYYRSLGFFKARVTHEMDFDEQEEWLSLKFIVDEGPRYVIRDIRIEGNEVYPQQSLLSGTQLREGEFFDLALMQEDVRVLKDSYGANGYIRADIKANPQFFEEPGQLDLVYKVDEGNQYRVGDIKVRIDGDYPHTRQNVVLNRMELREGDIIDIRKLREAERRIISSQLFESGPMSRPEIAVEPRNDGTMMADPGQRRRF